MSKSALEKSKASRRMGNRAVEGGAGCHSERMVRESLAGKVAIESRLEEGEREPVR